MNLLLIEPNIEGRIGEPPVNLALIKSFINEKTSHQAKIIDLTFHKKSWKKLLLKTIHNGDFNLIGFGCLSFNYNQAIEVLSFIKEHFKIPVIFGGVLSILKTQQIINNKNIDFVCTGEGEYTLKELMDNDLNALAIQGLWYKKNNNIIKNNNRPLIQDLDSMPFPDWSDYDLKKYFRVNINHLSIMGSRGCPYLCTYCSSHALKKANPGKWVRFRSVDNIIKEIDLRIKQYWDLGLRHFKMNDDTFILYRDHVLAFCKQYVEKGYNKKIIWAANVRANLVTDEIISTMKNAGCYEVGMGVESTNDFIRNNVYKRNMSMEQIKNAITIIKKHKIQLHIPIIIGAPYDTLEIMEKNLEFAKEIDAEAMLFPILMPLPGTEIREICDKEGLIEEDDFAGGHVMYTQPVVKTKYVSRKEISKFVKKIRIFLIKKYVMDGIKVAGLRFFRDLFIFFIYYKPKYKLEIDNAWKFTINKYNMEKHKREMLD